MARRGGGRSKDKGSGNSAEPRDVQISKAMSWLLRHGAKGEGIKMDANGYINVADLVSTKCYFVCAARLFHPQTFSTYLQSSFSFLSCGIPLSS